MKIKNSYPKISKDINKFIIVRKVILFLFLICAIVCAIVNISVGGKLWIFYVIGAEIIFYYTFLNKSPIDKSFVKKFTVLVFIICLYLYLIDILENTHWSYFVSSIIIFSLIIVQAILFFSAYKYQRKKFIPMFFTSVGSVIFCTLAIVKIFEMNWPVIVLGSLGLAMILILFTVFRKTIILELKKYFSIK